MEGRRMWEDLNMDCLLNVLGRVGVESLLLNVPFVCKSWYKATLNPSCWECLHFPHLGYRYCSKGNDESFQKRFTQVYGADRRISDTALVKFVVNRSRGRATSLKLPSCSRGLFKYSAKMFPELKVLSLPMSMKFYKFKMIADLIGKWKHLESLTFRCCYGTETILMQISRHCKKLRSLQLVDAYVCADKALPIAVFLPEIKQLILRGGIIDHDNLIMMLQHCKELVLLDVRDCVGFDPSDDEVLKFASHQ